MCRLSINPLSVKDESSFRGLDGRLTSIYITPVAIKLHHGRPITFCLMKNKLRYKKKERQNLSLFTNPPHCHLPLMSLHTVLWLIITTSFSQYCCCANLCSFMHALHTRTSSCCVCACAFACACACGACVCVYVCHLVFKCMRSILHASDEGLSDTRQMYNHGILHTQR